MNFVIENTNPKGKKTSDCVIRALARAMGYDYYRVYKDLYEMSLKTGYYLSDKKNYEKLLGVYGYIKVKQPVKRDNTKYVVKEFNQICCADALITINHHITYYNAAENSIYDLSSFPNAVIRNYFVKEGEII